MYLTARLRNAITPVLIHLDALHEPDEVSPASDQEMLQRAENRLREVEELAALLGRICHVQAESASPGAAAG